MQKLFAQGGYNIKYKTIKIMNKFHHYYPIKGKVPWQFKFKLKKYINFKYKIIIDIEYLDVKPDLYTVDIITISETEQFLNNMSAKDI